MTCKNFMKNLCFCLVEKKIITISLPFTQSGGHYSYTTAADDVADIIQFGFSTVWLLSEI